MAIIMIDCDDCYERADKFEALAKKCAEYSEKLGEECPELKAELVKYGGLFEELTVDIRKNTDIWADFYRRNVRL